MKTYAELRNDVRARCSRPLFNEAQVGLVCSDLGNIAQHLRRQRRGLEVAMERIGKDHPQYQELRDRWGQRCCEIASVSKAHQLFSWFWRGFDPDFGEE